MGEVIEEGAKGREWAQTQLRNERRKAALESRRWPPAQGQGSQGRLATRQEGLAAE